MERRVTEPYVRPDVAGFLAFLNNLPGPKMYQLEAPAARAAYAAMKDIADPPVGDLGTITDLTIPGPAGAIPARLFDVAESRAAGPLVVFFHGGGFVIGDLDTHASFCAEVSRTLDLPVLAVDYRLAPESPWPAAPDDCEAATRWVAGSPAELGRTFTGLIPMGDSAGGNLTIVTTQALQEKPAAVPVVIQVPIYPLSDDRPDHDSFLSFADGFLLTKDTMEWFADGYRAVPGDKRAYPLYGDHSNMPPTVLVTAGLDPIRDSGRVYGAQLILAGSDVIFLEMKGTIHGFTQIRKALPSAQADMRSIFEAVRLLLERLK